MSNDLAKRLRKYAPKGSVLIDCGNYGCVFKLRNKHVLKITTNLSEFETSRKLFKLQEHGITHSGFPEIYNIERRDGFFLIEREDIPEDIAIIDESWFWDVFNEVEEKVEFLLESMRPEKIAESEIISENLAQLFDDNPGEFEDELMAEQIADICKWAMSKGLVINDLTLENFGLRGDQVVVRDFGVFKAVEQ